MKTPGPRTTRAISKSPREGPDVDEERGADSEGDADEEGDSDVEAEGGENDQDDGEVDDTDDHDPNEGEGTPLSDAKCPEGFIFCSTCPPLSSTLEKNQIINRSLLFKWEKREGDAYGWYRAAKVAFNDATPEQKKKEPGLNFRKIHFTSRDTNKALIGAFGVQLTNDNYGPGKTFWVLVDSIPPP